MDKSLFKYSGKYKDTIEEELSLQLFGDEHRNVGTTSPQSPRNRSQSLYDRRLNDSIQAQGTPEGTLATDLLLSATTESLPRSYKRSDRRLRRLNTQLLKALKGCNLQEVERLLEAGANPNATCHVDLVSACHLAAKAGGDELSVLLKYGVEKVRTDRLGRTPLHLAAWAGNAKQIAILLGLPEDLQERVDYDNMSLETEEDIKRLKPKIKKVTNVRCDLGNANVVLPKDWRDDIDHNCSDSESSLPLIQPGWTPLHAASCSARPHCVRLLLAAGADPNIRDYCGRIPLEIAGSAIYHGQAVDEKHFTDVIRLLLTKDCDHCTIKGVKHCETPLHTAVELESLDSINELLKAGATTASLNRAGLTPLHSCVKKKLKEHFQILVNFDYSDTYKQSGSPMIEVRDKNGYTVLHFAVVSGWAPGVSVALEAGASITSKSNDGETPFHSAAALDNQHIFNEILTIAKQTGTIDYENKNCETALFKAIRHGQTECVKKLLKNGASIERTLPKQVNVFHVAAEHGFFDILSALLDHDYTVTRAMVNYLTADDRKGLGPIHLAVINNHPECVKLLLSRNAFISLKTSGGLTKWSTPLHLAAKTNNSEIAKIILKFDKTTVNNVDNMGWSPLHTACHHGSREIITLLLREGADLSALTSAPKKCRNTAIDMIMNNMSKPKQFMEDVFDTYMTSNNLNIQDPNCEVTVDYGILMPNKSNVGNVCNMETKVIEAILKTGNRFDQRRLLVHPLVESFLCLKWKALLPFFYIILTLYGLYVMSLTIFIVSVFFYKDTKEETPVWLNSTMWMIIVYITVCVVVAKEIFVINININSNYFRRLETWVKLSSLFLSVILPYKVIQPSSADWLRHVATAALLLSWLEMMFLLSRFPNWGYYVLMFGKVSSNVVKILLTFAFLIIGFALSFMIQFRSQTPFESPWAALVKTMVMMTSEFDYDDLVEKKEFKDFATSLLVVRIVFLIFLILAAIVLMNLMVGVAVNDLNNLEILGNIMRLEKQVEFLASLETLVFNRVFMKILPQSINDSLRKTKNLYGAIKLRPSEPSWGYYKDIPTHIRDVIFDKAQSQNKKMEDGIGFKTFNCKLDEIHGVIMKENDLTQSGYIDDSKTKRLNKLNELEYRLKDLDLAVVEVRKQMETYVQESKSSLEGVNMKIDLILNILQTKLR